MKYHYLALAVDFSHILSCVSKAKSSVDDANDVGMIQEADTAVCINGVQIMQFMTAQFRFLERLLMFMETEAINE
ncbi:hypothetical protein IGI04_036786 [Brassica rapa subsp. trilocularis]|uniref:Uncharacterized protein n=1 Tax=Brassica rapa subsp. trilocularis TaxID=1813537 RepID=A0ABQ7LHP9_BRACM|nr:hypothetical protein IGI04_036786 [Brassica rapa subsp. trilocularis]